MIEEACLAIERLSQSERAARDHKRARRKKMRYIDGLLNELELLNLSEQVRLPEQLVGAVDRLLEGTPVRDRLEIEKPETVGQAMDALYEVQDSLMVGGDDD